MAEQSESVAGGYRPVSAANDEIQTLLNSAKNEISSQLNMEIIDLTAISYTNRSVRGGNYLIKFVVNGELVVHVMLNKPTPNSGLSPTLLNVRSGFTLESSLEPL